jgi:hypothetical protein
MEYEPVLLHIDNQAACREMEPTLTSIIVSGHLSVNVLYICSEDIP